MTTVNPNAETEKFRCPWAQNDPVMQEYHDREWGVPQYDSRMLWELLMLEGFQAGLSWITVLKKRDAFRKAFKDFDAVAVAAFDEADVLRLLGDPGIIRSRAKIQATIRGARIYLEMQKSGSDFGRTVWTLHGSGPAMNDGPTPAKTPESERMSNTLKKLGFQFVGPTIVYAFMQASGMVNDHVEKCFRRER
jgi:DNA-3-methyladenine glycosylase I